MHRGPAHLQAPEPQHAWHRWPPCPARRPPRPGAQRAVCARRRDLRFGQRGRDDPHLADRCVGRIRQQRGRVSGICMAHTELNPTWDCPALTALPFFPPGFTCAAPQTSRQKRQQQRRRRTAAAVQQRQRTAWGELLHSLQFAAWLACTCTYSRPAVCNARTHGECTRRLGEKGIQVSQCGQKSQCGKALKALSWLRSRGHGRANEQVRFTRKNLREGEKQYQLKLAQHWGVGVGRHTGAFARGGAQQEASRGRRIKLATGVPACITAPSCCPPPRPRPPPPPSQSRTPPQAATQGWAGGGALLDARMLPAWPPCALRSRAPSRRQPPWAVARLLGMAGLRM